MVRYATRWYGHLLRRLAGVVCVEGRGNPLEVAVHAAQRSHRQHSLTLHEISPERGRRVILVFEPRC